MDGDPKMNSGPHLCRVHQSQPSCIEEGYPGCKSGKKLALFCCRSFFSFFIKRCKSWRALLLRWRGEVNPKTADPHLLFLCINSSLS